jgi:inhibitor of cysteine peptidase
MKSKKIVSWSCALLIAASAITTTSLAVNSNEGTTGPMPIEFEGKNLMFQREPSNVNGSLMVPVRETAEKWGIDVQWNSENKSIITTRGDTTLEWNLGSSEVLSSTGTVIKLPQAPYMENGQVYVPFRSLAERFGYVVRWNDALQLLSVQEAGEHLPLVESADHLANLLKENSANSMGGGYGYIALTGSVMAKESVTMTMQDQAGAVPAAAPASTEAKQTSSEASFSGTNVQVEGVDEADVVKTDGTYMYQVNREKIVITQAVPAGEMKVVSTLEFPDQSLRPMELYVDDKHLVVIGQSSPSYQPMPMMESSKGAAIGIWHPNGQQTAKAVIYDLTDRTNIQKLREVELEGSYLSSRKIGNSLYLITNKRIDSAYLSKDPQRAEQPSAAPAYRDSLDGDSFTYLPYDQIRYFPNAVVPNYIVVGGLDLTTPSGQFQVTSYVGSGDNVYASEDHLYVAMREYKNDPINQVSNEMKKMAIMPNLQINTSIYKFKLDRGMVESIANGKVPGTILNQFSMDEHNDSFRIATTSGDMWREDEYTSKNNVYVLDSTMNVTGKLEGLAPGERIYSVRFMGDRAYMVTFKKVDPLFVLDLKDPTHPQMLGKLKIPGYSDYLHPYDENHLIGIGKDAIEATNEWDPKGSTTAFYQGMKLAMFDVSDVANPIELFKESIGGRGTDSELLHNHKALLYSKEKGLLAFPVTVMEETKDIRGYGQFVFQGMYVYNLDLRGGFQLRGKITHLSQEDIAKAGNGWYESDLNVMRGLYIDNVLYTLSQGKIKANDLSSLKDISEIKLP